jgi:hypothetical protein
MWETDRLALAQVRLTLLFDYALGEEQREFPVDGACGARVNGRDFCVAALTRDFVTEKLGGFVTRVGYQCLFFRQLEFQLVFEEDTGFPLNLFGIRFRADYPDHEVIGIPTDFCKMKVSFLAENTSKICLVL